MARGLDISKKDKVYDLVIVGGGLAGLVAVRTLVNQGFSVALVRPRVSPDQRTTALMAGAVDMLDQLGVWSEVADQAAPLNSLKIVDMTGRLLRAPTVHFLAHDAGVPAFAYNVANDSLLAALLKSIENDPGVDICEGLAETLVQEPDLARVGIAGGGSLSGRLVIAADGRQSVMRTCAGLGWTQTDYPQTALAMTLVHDLDHENCSVEFHTPPGPCTFVPLPGKRSALVWVMTPDEARHRSNMSNDELLADLSALTCGHLLLSSIEGGRGVFPLATGFATSMHDHRLVLIGEAAHILPPIGAQGLNLGLRDVAVLSESLSVMAGDDPGLPSVIDHYSRLRRQDVTTRRWAADILNRTLMSESLLAQGLRFTGLQALQAFAPLRHLMMRQGMGGAKPFFVSGSNRG